MLQVFLELSDAKCNLLIDKDGHMVTEVGSAGNLDSQTIAALIAGSFAATREMAKLLGEDEFSVLFHQGKCDSIQLFLVGDRTILATIFDQNTTVGMVRLYAKEAEKKLASLFEEIAKRKGMREGISGDYSDLAKGELDKLFDGESKESS